LITLKQAIFEYILKSIKNDSSEYQLCN